MRSIRPVFAWRITAQRDQMAYALVPVGAGDGEDLLACSADTGEVWSTGECGVPLDVRHHVVGALARRAIRAVGYRHEARRERCETFERAPQHRLHRRICRWKELE